MNELLQEIFYILTYLIPRPVAVEPNEKAVLLRFGRYKSTCRPGWTWVWLPIENIQAIDSTEQVIDVRGQSLTTSDDKTIAISGSISYRVIDPRKALLDVQDIDTSLPTLSLGIISGFVAAHTFGECRQNKKISGMVRRRISKIATERWGLEVLHVWITDLAEHKVIRVIGDSVSVIPDEED